MAEEFDPVDLILWGTVLYVAYYLIAPAAAATRRRSAAAIGGTAGMYGTGTSGTPGYGSPLAMIGNAIGSAPIGTGNTQATAPIGIGNTEATAPIGGGNQGTATPGYINVTPERQAATVGTDFSPGTVNVTPQVTGTAPIGTGNQQGTAGGGTSPQDGAPGDQSGKFYGPFGVSANGVAFVKNEEGLSLNRFLDAGHWAIGYGHDYPAGQIPPASITQGQADALLAQDLDAVVASLNSRIGVPLTQNQFDALVSIGFNVGTAGFPSLLNAVNAGNDTLAASLFGLYDHSQGKVLPALAARRAREAQLYLS